MGLIHPTWLQTEMGGAEADITPEASTKGIRQFIQTMTLADTDKFFKWNVEIHPW